MCGEPPSLGSQSPHPNTHTKLHARTFLQSPGLWAVDLLREQNRARKNVWGHSGFITIGNWGQERALVPCFFVGGAFPDKCPAGECCPERDTLCVTSATSPLNHVPPLYPECGSPRSQQTPVAPKEEEAPPPSTTKKTQTLTFMLLFIQPEPNLVPSVPTQMGRAGRGADSR